MELKPYQDAVLTDLGAYLDTLIQQPDLRSAFATYWSERGVVGQAYKNNVPGVPHVCAKVPTAGGKTFIAVNALRTIFDAFKQSNPARPQMVVWLVPSLTILDQTVRALSDASHPYRQRLNALFKGRVAVYERRDLLMGAGFSADIVREQLSIVVMSFDSLRARNKEDRKIYKDNGYLASFVSLDSDASWLHPDYDASSLINVLRSLKPVVVVDESHNAETELSVEMLVNLNPDFILDLTATPRNNSNIISYVDAMQLKRNHMVKLPVIVANRTSREDVIESALTLRRKLEQLAVAQEQAGGRYIRPIVLFQAQPKSSDDNTTFDKVREQLIAAGIPSDEIKIKTATINELAGVDLMSPSCPVRYIITINALKEGWDCPFAYILASLADKSSAVDVEQLLGRVLRMPHVQPHGNDLLNLSYVFTSSNKFSETLQSVVRALNRSGFSDRDYRAVDPVSTSADPTHKPVQTDWLATTAAVSEACGDEQAATYPPKIPHSSNEVVQDHSQTQAPQDVAGLSSAAEVFIQSLTQQAAAENQAFTEKAAAADNLPLELETKVNRHRIKDVFRPQVLALKLPQFFIPVSASGWFEEDNALHLLERDELLGDFRLATADAAVSFDDIEGEMYRVDLEKSGDKDYAPKPFKVDSVSRQRFNAIILSQSRESQIRDVTDRLTRLIGDMWPMTEEEVRKYVARVIDPLSPEQIQDCLDRDHAYARKLKLKIDGLANAHATKVFGDLLDLDKITLAPGFSFSEYITPSANAPALPKSLYTTEASMGQFEQRVINAVANLESVEWWHRNLSRGKGYRINGFLNHYPDFILHMKSERVILLETKGDDRDNSDSANKLRLGKQWEAKAGPKFKYMMLFENNPIAGAENLSDGLSKLKQL